MKIAEEHLAAVRAFGYTEAEARFLYLVATHSGYFVLRQFLNMTGAKWGRRTAKFIRKLERSNHTNCRKYFGIGAVYHLYSKSLYAQIGRENLGNHRSHSVEFIQTRLVLLDFIIANQQHDYFETEAHKTAYFSETLGIPKTALPVRTYAGPSSSDPALRYFADKLPIFLDGSVDLSNSPVTFCYVESTVAGGAGLRRHLDAYKQLLSNLAGFSLVYVSNTTANFPAAERCFAAFREELRENRLAEMIRYFTLRARRDEGGTAPRIKEVGSLTGRLQAPRQDCFRRIRQTLYGTREGE
ncbi:MAG: hypothetical protein WA581_05055 [Candidatus Acidiferrales bacterium]